ncbi:hypothetical protein ACFPZ0_18650 [Streptomonospora nanhaiensis]|uniref:Uncharacterized protein n=1 Tax=Streptomonospora nanhaiensis TaxID=1323731 RepID=A0A853BJ80_9ACTN|nr:hypothetical protein [Streptomonospora nanhaiensis]NYI94651.1 hypothetical protein [Streptomonospora nanhaiensis]
MGEDTRARWLSPRLEAARHHPELVPEQARPVDLVVRSCGTLADDTGSQREVAVAAARTAVAEEIERRRPGEPYMLRQGRVHDFCDVVPECPLDEYVVVGVVYRR